MRDLPQVDQHASKITGLISVGVAVVAVALLMVIAEPPDGHRDRVANDRQSSPATASRARTPKTRIVRTGRNGLGIDFAQIQDADERKKMFVRALLPVIQSENNRIRRERKIARKKPSYRLYRKYRIKRGKRAFLLQRVDVIPPALAIAQAAIESAWGTSRFVLEGNNLYGERTYSRRAKGMAPRDATGFKVTSFRSVTHSVRSYMHNLNTHRAYRKFRAERARIRAKRAPTGDELAAYLEAYSEQREVYVRTIRRVIRDNRLEKLSQRRLARR